MSDYDRFVTGACQGGDFACFARHSQLGNAMRYLIRPAAVIAAGLAFLAVAGCAATSQSGTATVAKPARLEKVAGSDVNRVILKPEAATSIGIQKGRIQAATSQQSRTVVPYAAVLYDATGKTWVYQPAADLTFVRQPIVVERIDGDNAILSQSPPAGTEVVTIGAAELYGTELGVGK
jgi:hypothetical protein